MRVRCATDDKWFDSIDEAAEAYGVSPALILKSCKQPGRKVAEKLWHGDYGENYQKNFDDVFLIRQPPKVREVRGEIRVSFKEVGVRCVEDNLIFASTEEAAKHYGYNIATIAKSIRRMTGVDKGRRHFHYVGDQSIQTAYDKYVSYVHETGQYSMTLREYENLE